MKKMVGILMMMFVLGFGLVKIGTAVTNAQGDLDTSFGTGGIVNTDLGDFDVASDVLIQDNGKIVALGAAYGVTTEFFAVRYESDGTVDTSYGTAGIVETDGAGGALLANGKMLVAGSRLSGGGDSDFSLARYNEDGVLDTAFGVAGVITTSISGNDDVGQDIHVASDGKIVVTGSSGNSSAIVRYNSDGTLDTTLNSSGIITGNLFFPTGSDVYPDGKIIITGRTGGYFNTTRYNVDGSLDTGFGGDGTVNTSGFIPLGILLFNLMVRLSLLERLSMP